MRDIYVSPVDHNVRRKRIDNGPQGFAYIGIFPITTSKFPLCDIEPYGLKANKVLDCTRTSVVFLLSYERYPTKGCMHRKIF